MNLNELNNDIAKEVLTILLFCNKNIQDKIPKKVIKDLSLKAADSLIEIHLDKNKKLDEQKISKEALDIFSIIYCLYVAKEQEKDEIINSWILNEKNNI